MLLNLKTDYTIFDKAYLQDSINSQYSSKIPDLTQELPKDSVDRQIELNNRAADKFSPLTKLAAQEQNIPYDKRTDYSPSSVNDGFIKKNQDFLSLVSILFALFLIFRFLKKR